MSWPTVAQSQQIIPPNTDFGDAFVAYREAIFSGIANQVGNLPFPTGGGFAFEFDPNLGTFTRKTESFGPIFADRYETTGGGKFTLNASYTRHTFDTVDGVELRTGEFSPFIFPIVPGSPPLRTQFQFRDEVDVDVFTLGGIYGITNRIDVGIIVPILRVKVRERATVVSSCVQQGDVCTPVAQTFPLDLRPTEEEATGIGDVVLRGKYNFLEFSDVGGGRFGLATSLDVKLPTGDEGNRSAFTRRFPSDPTGSGLTIGDPPLGTGIVRVKPQLIASGSWFNLSPHVNLGVELGTTEGITNDFVAAVGLDYAPLPWITVAGDVLIRHAFDEDRRQITSTGAAGLANPDVFTLSLGAKANPIGTLIVFFNILLPLNNTGVRDDVTPTVGLEWSF
jgi:hypothetical protein